MSSVVRDCSVIVCTRRRPAELTRCLASVAAVNHDVLEVLVVDNSEGDPTTREIATEAGARYLLEPQRGLSTARNTGALAAAGELLAFIDDDGVADSAWLRAHGKMFALSTVVATTGRILPISTQETQAPLARMLDLGERPLLVDRATADWFELANFGGLGFGGNMVFRRDAFDHGFRFCERLGRGAGLNGGEESYAFFSLIRDGNSIAYVPDAVVYHEAVAPAQQRARELEGARRYAAYLCMLLAEEPEFRLRTMRYVVDALRRPPKPWRRIDPRVRAVSHARILLAAAGGPLQYLKSRRAAR